MIAWSDDATRMDGDISATGAVSGGFVETSGRFDLAIGEGATVSLGRGGQWLLDPRNVSIVRPDGTNVSGGTTNPPNGSGAYTVNADSIEKALDAGSDVTITTEQARRDDLGDILVLSPLSWTGTGALRLVADEDVTIRQSITTERGDFFAIADDDIEIEAPVTSTGSANLIFQTLGITPFAGSQIRIYDNVVASGTGSIVLDAQKGPVRFLGNASTNLIMRTQSGDLTISAGSADQPSDRWDFGTVIVERESDQSGSNVQIYSKTGSVDITADTGIDLNGGNGRSGKWVRVGRTDSSSDVTLTAPKITITGGDKTNNFSEAVAGSGGSLSMRADAITLQNGAGFARALAQSGAGLSMLAETQTWNGRVEAGTDPVTGGETEISGAITATVQPRFSLSEDRSFVLRATTPRGAPSSYRSDLALAVDTSGTGTIDVGGPVVARQVTLLSQARVGIGADARVTGTGPGDAVVISAGAQFRNEAGPGSVQASDQAARWLVYIDAFAGLDGAAPGPRGYDLYNRFYDDNLPDSLANFGGNRIVYGEQPVLTITAETLSKTYGRTATPGYTIGALRPGDTAAVALDGAPSADSAGSPAAADAGSYATLVSARASDQGYRLRLVPGTLTVNPAALTVTANDATRTYGGADPAFSATYDGLVLGQTAADLTGALDFTNTALPASGVGTYSLTPGGQTSRNYAITYAPGAFAITPAALTVTPEGARTYGSLDTVYSPTFTGFVLGEGPDSLDGTLTHSTDATLASDAGTYGLTASGLSDPNYAITFADGTLTIDTATLTVTADDAARGYGAANPAFTASYDGFVLDQDADDLGGTLDFATDARPESDVGTYRVTPGGQTSRNYTIAYAPGALAITPAALTVTANDATRTYGGADPAFSATYDGLVLGQTAADLTGALDFTNTALPASGVGTYSLTPGGQTSRNYAITYAPGAFAITPAALTVTPEGARTYGSLDTVYSPTFTGFVLGEGPDSLDGTLTHSTDATLASDAGTYGLTASGLSDPNYAITFADGTLTIDTATLTVTADDAARGYGAANPAFTATYDGFVLDQDADDLGGTLDFATDARPDSDVGTYRVTPGGQTSRNYTIAYAPGALAITPAALTVTANDATRTYGAADPAFSATYDGLVLGQTAADLTGALDFTNTALPASGVGTYSLTPGGQTSRNYAITYAPGAFAITPAALTVTPEGARTYGSLDTVYSPTFTGFVLGEGPDSLDGTLTHSTDATLASDAGTYGLTASGLSDPNYAITFADGTLEIGRAALRVRADDATRIAGQPDPAFTATYEGFVLGQTPDTLDGDLDIRTPANAQSPAGLYTLTPGGQTGRNYDIAWIDGTLAVQPARPQPPLPPEPPQPPAPPVATGLTPLNDLTREFGRGVPPLTPGDASFRTTVTEAPPAIDSPFALTYSLGEIVQLAPQGAPGAQTGGFVAASGGFVPASGGIAPADPAAANAADAECGGPINTGDGADCARLTATENFWTSTAEGTP